MSYRTRVFAILLAAALAGPLAAQQKVAKTDQEKQGAEQFNKAIAAYAAGNYKECIPLFIAADSLIGGTELVDRAKLRFALGSAFMSTGQPAKALEYFKLVAEKDPGYPGIQLQMAESARAAGKKTEALGYFRAALNGASAADLPVIQGRIGELEFAAGRLQAALDAINKAIQSKPATPYFLIRGQIYDKLAQKLDHAEDQNFDYERAIRHNEITEEQMQQATELRNKALDDYRNAQRDPALAEDCGVFIQRSEVILKNNENVISEINYQKENN